MSFRGSDSRQSLTMPNNALRSDTILTATLLRFHDLGPEMCSQKIQSASWQISLLFYFLKISLFQYRGLCFLNPYVEDYEMKSSEV